jgi:hypothetical protein
MTDKEAMKLALKALQKARYRSLVDEIVDPAITVLEARLAQPEQEPQDWKTPPKEDAPLVKWAKEQTIPPQRTEQEPVALHIGWLVRNSQGKLDLLTELQIDSSLEKYERLHKLYTTPPQRKPLTDEQIQQIVLTAHGNQDWTLVFARAIEAAHHIKE